MQRLVIHPAEHQHLAGVELLDDRGDQSGGVPLEGPCEVLGEGAERRGGGGGGLLRHHPQV